MENADKPPERQLDVKITKLDIQKELQRIQEEEDAIFQCVFEIADTVIWVDEKSR